MKRKIGDTEYNIIPIPPHLSPFSTLISERLQLKPEGPQDAETISQQIAEAMKALLSGTVKPYPKPEHETQVFNALIDITNKVIHEAQFFRKDKRPNAGKGNSARPGDSQAPK